MSFMAGWWWRMSKAFGPKGYHAVALLTVLNTRSPDESLATFFMADFKGVPNDQGG